MSLVALFRSMYIDVYDVEHKQSSNDLATGAPGCESADYAAKLNPDEAAAAGRATRRRTNVHIHCLRF